MKDRKLRKLLHELGLITIGRGSCIYGWDKRDLHLKIDLIMEHLKLEFVDSPCAFALQKRKK